MIKAIGQNGLNFIASKYKELKKLVSKKADKTEIITKEERYQLEVARKQFVAMEIENFEAKLKAGSDSILKYPNGSSINMFNFIDDVQSGKIKPPEGIQLPYTYSFQQWYLNNDSFKPYALCDTNMKTLSLEQISAVKKNDGTMCLVNKNIMDGIDSYFSASKALVTTNEYFVKQEDNKGLSTNDYDNTAKAKVDAIPANPKYTDTTYDLSKYAEKSDISRCKTDGYANASSWSSVSSSRDLEDWIGDFDKRTRELKSNKGLTGDKSEMEQKIIENPRDRNSGGFVLAKWGRIVSVTGFFDTSSGSTSMSADIPVKFSPLDGCEFLCDQGTVGFNVYRDSSGRVNRCEAIVNADSNRRYKTVRWNVVFFSASA